MGLTDKLIILADKFDTLGLTKYANLIDQIIISSAKHEVPDTGRIMLPIAGEPNLEDVGLSIRLENGESIAKEILESAIDKIAKALRKQEYDSREISYIINRVLKSMS